MRLLWAIAVATPLALILLLGWQTTLLVYLIVWAIGIPALIYFWWWMHTWPEHAWKKRD